MVGIKINLGSYEAPSFCKGLRTKRARSVGESKKQMPRKAERGWRENPVESQEFSSSEAWLHSCPWALGRLPYLGVINSCFQFKLSHNGFARLHANRHK